MKLTIKQAAEVTGLSADTLRYYEKEGMLSPKRYENGYRYYDESDISALKYIVVMKYARFTLSEMKVMEELQAHESCTRCNEICKHIFDKKINGIKGFAHIVNQLITHNHSAAHLSNRNSSDGVFFGSSNFA